ncbi:MAG: heparinase II/III family protein [Opitutaceae bacterium]|nr:heparinase II/III family protein [Opitutaceae bacterium]
MSTSRRTFLKNSAVLTASLPLTRIPLSAARPAPAPTGNKRGLLFDAADLPRIRANTKHPRFAAYWQSLLDADGAADTNFLRTELRLTNHVTHLLRAQQILDRTSFVYLVNRDPAQRDLAKLAMRRMLDFPEWDCFVEGNQILGLQRATEGSFSLLLALDCLGDALTPAERAEVEQAVLTKGIPACHAAVYGMKYPDRVRGWGWNPRSEVDALRYISLKRWPLILNSTNLKIIPTACLGIAACWFRDRPEAASWLELARSSAKSFSTMYGSDGCYDEGVSYWGYTTLYLALFAEVLWRTHGIDDRSLINYPGTIRYALGNTMPTIDDHRAVAAYAHLPGYMMPVVKPQYDIVNHGDANGSVEVSVASWIARTHKDSLAQYVATRVGEVKQVYGLIWFGQDLPATPPTPALLDIRQSNDIVISRTGWATMDNVLALRSGGPGNHEHADRNSVIFKAYGERLLHDPFRASYIATQPRWMLRLTSAHTAVLINGAGHQYHDGSEGTNASWAFAHVTDYRTGPDWMTVTSDATEAYALVNDKVTRVLRTLVYLKPDVVVFLDQVSLSGTTATVQVRFQANNEDLAAKLAIENDSFRIVRPHASLLGRVARAPGLALHLGKLPLEEKDGTQPYAEIESAAAGAHEILTVCTARPAGEAHGDLHLSREGASWRVTGSHARQKVNVTIRASASGSPLVTIA